MPQVTLQLQHRDSTFPLQITIEPDHVRGQRSVGGRALIVPFQYKFLPQSTMRVSNLQSLANQCRVLGIQARLTWRGGRGFREGWVPMTLAGYNNGIRLDLDDATVEWIEQWREGNPISLDVQLVALCLIPDLTHPILVPQPNSDRRSAENYQYSLITIDYSPGEASIMLDRERWLEILRGMEWGDTRLVELPPSDIPNPPGIPWQKVARQLQQATSEYRQGEFEKTVNTVRIAVEGVATELARHWGLKPWSESHKSFDDWTKELEGRLSQAWPSDPKSSRLLATLFATTWHWASEPHHYNAKTARRREAKFALNLLTDLLEFIPHLVAVHPEPSIFNKDKQTKGEHEPGGTGIKDDG